MNDTHCKISAATLARTAALALALTNQVLSACGKPMLPIESATVEQLVTTGLTVAAALAGWWKNNSFTPGGHRSRRLSGKAAEGEVKSNRAPAQIAVQGLYCCKIQPTKNGSAEAEP